MSGISHKCIDDVIRASIIPACHSMSIAFWDSKREALKIRYYYQVDSRACCFAIFLS